MASNGIETWNGDMTRWIGDTTSNGMETCMDLTSNGMETQLAT